MSDEIDSTRIEPTLITLEGGGEVRLSDEAAQRFAAEVRKLWQQHRSLEAERERLKGEARRLEDEAMGTGNFYRCDSCQRVVRGLKGRRYDATPEGYLFECDECAEAAQQEGGG